MVTKLYTENSNKTMAELRKIAVGQGLRDEFEKFFQFSTAEDSQPVDEEEFQKIVEILENQLYSMNDVGIDNQKYQASESESHFSFAQQADDNRKKLIERCFNYLNEQGHEASSQLSDAMSLILESDISSLIMVKSFGSNVDTSSLELDSKNLKDILQAIKSKVDDVADQIKNKDIEYFQVKNYLGLAEKDIEYLRAEIETNLKQMKEINESNAELRESNERVMQLYRQSEFKL